MRKIFAVFALLSLSLSFVGYASAAEILQADKNSGNLTVPAAETHRNPYIAGGNVAVNGSTLGDLVAAGGTISVTGSVEQNTLLAGGTITLSGPVGNSVRVAGGMVTIGSSVGGDVVVAGGTVILSNEAQVKGDLFAAGGSIDVSAPVSGMVKIAGGDVTINSTISGDVSIKANKKVTFGPNTRILGKMVYEAPEAATVQPGAELGSNVSYIPYHQKNWAAGFFTLGLLVKLAALILAGLLLMGYRKNLVGEINATVLVHPWESLGIGFAACILIPILVVILLVTFVGYYIAIALGLAYILTLLFATVFSVIFVGTMLLKLGNKNAVVVGWHAVVVGVIFWTLIRFIPIVGWVVMALVFLAILGAMVKAIKFRLKEKNTEIV